MNSYTWTRNGVAISENDDVFNQSIIITDRSNVISQLVLSKANNSSLTGTFQCRITDGIGRNSMASHITNGKPSVMALFTFYTYNFARQQLWLRINNAHDLYSNDMHENQLGKIVWHEVIYMLSVIEPSHSMSFQVSIAIEK